MLMAARVGSKGCSKGWQQGLAAAQVDSRVHEGVDEGG